MIIWPWALACWRTCWYVCSSKVPIAELPANVTKAAIPSNTVRIIKIILTTFLKLESDLRSEKYGSFSLDFLWTSKKNLTIKKIIRAVIAKLKNVDEILKLLLITCDKYLLLINTIIPIF